MNVQIKIPAQRHAWMDNAKFIMVAAVVAFHFLCPYGADRPANSAFSAGAFIALGQFIMPGFCMAAGIYAKSRPSWSEVEKSIVRLLVPYLIFETIVSVANRHQVTTMPYLRPSVHLWFLPALACWRTMLPYFVALRGGWVLAFALAVYCGYSEEIGYTLTLSRIFYFFPFFMLGHLMGRHAVDWNPSLKVRSIAWIVLAIGLIWPFFFDSLDPRWLLGSYGYASVGVTEWWAGGIRMLIFLVSIVLSVAFFAVVPRKRMPWTPMGQYSLYPYLLQAIPITLLIMSGIYDQPSLLTEILLLPLAVVATYLMSTSLCRKATRWLIEPPVERLVLRSSKSATEASR